MRAMPGNNTSHQLAHLALLISPCYFMEMHEYETMKNICLACQLLGVESTPLLTVRVWLNQVRTEGVDVDDNTTVVRA